MNEARPLDQSERLARLRLARSENVGAILFRELIDRYGSATDALDALPDLARRGGRKRKIRICPEHALTSEIEALERLGATWIVFGDALYPARLANIEDPPPVISCLGRVEILSRPAIAIVGARNASANGRQFARRLARDLGGGGQAIVSGLARGIDTAAHEGALDAGTIAVVAGGVDVVYPKENRDLYEAIAERGAVVAENPVGTTPQARHFPRRNRIISGLATGVVVVEAAGRSGSLITARLAGEQGRDVFAVPGSPLDPRCRGTNNLLRQGAVLTESADDVLGNMLNKPPRPPAGGEAEEPASSGAGEFDTDEARLGTARETILGLLGAAPIEIDTLIRESGLDAAAAKTALIELELAGRIDRQAGAKVARIAP